MKTIDTLIEDIYNLLASSNKELTFDAARVDELSKRLAQHVKDEVQDPDRSDRDPDTVYVTQITSNCPRRRWYEHNAAAHNIPREKITGQNRFKFLYGDLIEESVLFLAELAGHTVELRQEALEMLMQRGSETHKLRGRIDAVIDGVLVDVKSMESFTFDRFHKGTYEDKWGYGNQLETYHYMMLNDKRYTPPKHRMILGINKLNGRMHLAEMPPTAGFSPTKALADVVAKDKSKAKPDRQTYMQSGMECLDTLCSYCPFKMDCYKSEGGLRVYAYSEAPRFVVGTPTKPPKVPEITEAWLQETH